MKALLSILVVLAVVAQASAQSTNLNTVSKTGTISANGGYVEFTTATIGGLGGGFGSVKVQTLDSYSGTWEVQCSVDGSLAGYDAASELKLTPTDSSTVAYSVTDTVAIWDVGNASGCQSIRVIATAGFAASNVTVAITATQSGGSSGGGGGGGGGEVSNNGTFVVQENGAALTSLNDIAGYTLTMAGSLATIASNLSTDADYNVTVPTRGPLSMCNGSAATPTVLGADGRAISVWCDLYGRPQMNLSMIGGVAPVADGAAQAGNPLYIGGLSTTSIVGQTPVSTAQRIGFVGGADRVLITRPYANLEDRVSGHVANTDGAATSLVASQGGGTRFCATNFIVSNSSATNVTVLITDGSGGTTLTTIPAAANMGGAVVNLGVPLCTSAATAMYMDGSAAATTVSVTAIGFKTEL